MPGKRKRGRPPEPPRIRQRANGRWYIVDGDIFRSTGTRDKERAECIFADYLVEKERPQDPKIGELLDFRLAALKTARRARAKIVPYYHRQLRASFGMLTPNQISLASIDAYIKRRSAMPGALREELRELQATLSQAKKRRLIDDYPIIDVPAPRPPRDVFLSREQAQRLFDAAELLHLRVFLMLAMATGARTGAILRLTWDLVNLDRGWVDFQDPTRSITKKRATSVPVDQPVIAALSEARQFALTNHVVEFNGKPVASIRKAFAKARAKAGLPWASPHILKHSAISWMAESGRTVDEISDMTATHPQTVRRIYRKFSPDYLRDALKILSNAVDFGTIVIEKQVKEK